MDGMEVGEHIKYWTDKMVGKRISGINWTQSGTMFRISGILLEDDTAIVVTRDDSIFIKAEPEKTDKKKLEVVK